MRSSDCGVIPGLSETTEASLSLEFFRKMCRSKYFEQGIIEAVNSKDLTYLVYLTMGQEAVPAALSCALDNYAVFAQHRCHGTYLAFGGEPEKLRDELLGLQTGCSGGRAGSNCVQFDHGTTTMFGHHGLIGENVPLAAGYALGSGRPTVCLFGDGAAEEDYVFASLGFAATNKLPLLFVCEDNNLSILTPVSARRTWSIVNVAKAFGLTACEIADDPWTIHAKARELSADLPALITIHTCRANWHAGTGTDGPPEWDRFSMVRDELKRIGLEKEAADAETQTQASMKDLWENRL